MIAVGLLSAKSRIQVAKCSIINERTLHSRRVKTCSSMFVVILIVFNSCHPSEASFDSKWETSSKSSLVSSSISTSSSPFKSRSLSSWDHELRRSPNITDLIVQVGQNVLLECSNLDYHHLREQKLNTNNADDDEFRHDFRYLWCRLEDTDWLQAQGFSRRAMIEIGDELDLINDRFHSRTNTRSRSPCFEGGRHFIASENNIATVLYRCSIENNHGRTLAIHHWKLYVDQFTNLAIKREKSTTVLSTSLPSLVYTTIVPKCHVPRCKAYASVIHSECSTIVLKIRYPKSQYGYNESTNEWTTVHCDSNIDGYQIWIIGQGVVKKFPQKERLNNITITGLVPGRRYCFNGWAYNSCGAGPVFTLEGVCVRNLHHCVDGSSISTTTIKTTTNVVTPRERITSDGTSLPDVNRRFKDSTNHQSTIFEEHCELDFDYGLN